MESNSAYQAVNHSYEDLFGLPLDRETLFSNHKGKYKKGIEKRQKKILQEVTFIKRFLQEDERILLITTGCSPTSVVEQLLMGWIFLYLKRSLLIFTNKRIFHIPTKQNYSYLNLRIKKRLRSYPSSIQVEGIFIRGTPFLELVML